MNKAILGHKLGMSQIFAPDGRVIPVTVIQAGPCPIVQKKTTEKDGYNAIKVGFGLIKEQNVNKPMLGIFKKAKVTPTRHLKEFRFDNCEGYEVGKNIDCTIFAEGDHVDVTGTTKGRGFTGTIQRWNTHCGPKAHGSGFHRGVGSMGANTDPARVFKNKKLPGQYGSEQVTVQNLAIARVDAKRNILLVTGGVPGARNSLVIIKQTLKG